MKAKPIKRQLTAVIGLLILTLALASLYLLNRPKTQGLSSPVCDKVTFTRGHSIFIANPDGSMQTQLARSPENFPSKAYLARLAWSPDGTMLAYSIGNLTMYDAHLYVLHAEENSAQSLIKIHAHSEWGWSPDSEYIYEDYHNSSGLNSFTLHGIESGEAVCTDQYDRQNPIAVCGPFNVFYGEWLSEQAMMGIKALTTKLDGAVVQGRPHLSPDKQWVAFSSYNANGNDWHHHIARVNGADLVTYHSTEGWRNFCLETSWSPDSRRLVFAVRQGDEMHLSIVSSDDGNVVPLVRVDGMDCPHHLKWNESGQYIGFSVGGPASQRWYTVDVVSEQMVPLPLDEKACSWSQSGDWLGCYLPDSVVVMNVDQVKRFDLIDTKGSGTWSSCDRWFGFSTSNGIFVFDTAISKMTRISADEGALAWAPRCR